jgi:hypothetical protein
MIQREVFKHFLSKVLAQTRAEPAEPEEPCCSPAPWRHSHAVVPCGTCGTALPFRRSGSGVSVEPGLPCGTSETFAQERFQRSGSAVPQFQTDEDLGASPNVEEDERSAIAIVDGHVPAIYARPLASL